jgi:hypothetical protein
MKLRVTRLLAYAATVPLLGYAAGSIVEAEGPQCCMFSSECDGMNVCCTTPEGVQPCSLSLPHYCRDTGGNWCTS